MVVQRSTSDLSLATSGTTGNQGAETIGQRSFQAPRTWSLAHCGHWTGIVSVELRLLDFFVTPTLLKKPCKREEGYGHRLIPARLQLLLQV